MKKGDWILIFAILLAATLLLVFLQPSAGALTAVVYVSGERITTIDLSRVREPYTLEAGGCVLLVEPGRICFQKGHCPDETCARCGWLDRAGQTAACLPNRTVVVLSGAPDGITGDA